MSLKALVETPFAFFILISDASIYTSSLISIPLLLEKGKKKKKKKREKKEVYFCKPKATLGPHLQEEEEQ
ncbi:hypothetical protein ACOSQ3_018568 [Xanthoceras sorbifolium]